MRLKFNDSVRYFNCCGIELIGDFSTGTIIGLDEDGNRFVKNLINGGDCVPITEKEKELLQQLKISGFFEKLDTSVLNVAYFHVTSKCNLNCIGCYSDETNRNEKRNLSTEQCYKIIDNLKRANITNLIISGGEPLLRNDLPEILRYAKHTCNIPTIQVVSNGMIRQEKYENILPYIDSLSVSVDGYNENVCFLRDSDMKRVINTVKHLSKLTTKLCMIFTLHAQNIRYISKYVELSRFLQVPFSFSLLTVKKDTDLSKFFLDESSYSLLNSIERQYALPIDEVTNDNMIGCRNSCGLGRRMISIASDGDIYPCHMLHEIDLKMGNAINEEISNVLGKNCNLLDVSQIEECKKCEYKYLCGGGCYARRFFETQDVRNSHDPCCDIYKTDIARTFCELMGES